MADFATNAVHFDTLTGLGLEVAFDGGLAWLAQVDQGLGLCEAIARHVPEWRSGKVQHSLLELVRQRVYQIACRKERPTKGIMRIRTMPIL